jgi:cyclopropane fatty-acyl-phospholipid synthase-like methyltransferase
MTTNTKYDHAAKIKIINIIKNIKDVDILKKIHNIVSDDENCYLTENNNGSFGFFSNLKENTYDNISFLLQTITKKNKKEEFKREYNPYSKEEFSNKTIGAKLKLSNKEKSLLKKSKNENQQYSKFNLEALSDSDNQKN